MLELLVRVVLAEINFVLVKLLSLLKTWNLFSNLMCDELDSACDVDTYCYGAESDCRESLPARSFFSCLAVLIIIFAIHLLMCCVYGIYL